MFIPTTQEEKERYQQAHQSAAALKEDGMSEGQIEMMAQMLMLSFDLAIELGWDKATRFVLSIAQTNCEMKKFGL